MRNRDSARRAKLVTWCWLFFSGTLLADENWVVLGDSLTKEYSLEFPLLHPTNPAAWAERNWIELLSDERNEHVDIGPMALWPDSRLTGHEYNWAFPGSTSEEWREILEASFFSDPQLVLLRSRLDPYLENVADRVVIFLGGNDLKNNYSPYYDGADPQPFIASLVSNLQVIVDYVRDLNADVPIVLAGMPDVSITPTVKTDKPDPEKRKRNTALTEETNRRLRLLAQEEQIGFADIGALTAQLDGPERFVIAGIRFFKGTDPNPIGNAPEYIFSPDGFHPNTVAQLLFANAIVEAFNETYPDLPTIEPFATEELLGLLGFDPDMPFQDWLAAYGIDPSAPIDLDGDQWPLDAEFILGMDPRRADPERAPVFQTSPDQLRVHFSTRIQNSGHGEVIPQQSLDLSGWDPLPVEQVTKEGPTTTAHLPVASAPNARGFIRLAFPRS